MQYLIVGGGIIGMMTAYFLRNEGADVTLIDRQQTGKESSWAGGGIISPLYPWRYPESVTRLASRSQQSYAQLCDKLHEESGIDPEYVRNGLLIVTPEEEQDATLWASKHDISLDIIPHETIQQLEPALHQHADSAVWMPDVAQVRNPRIAKSLRKAIDALGVRVLEGHAMQELLSDGTKVTGVRTDTEVLEADHVVLCTGAWTADLIARFSDDLPVIEPVRGQMLLFHAEPGIIQRILLWNDRYAIPRKDGRVVFGSTLEYTGFIKETTESAAEELFTEVTTRYPVLKNYPLEKHWAGLRPGSPSGVPYIARHPGYDNLYINAGHYRNGVVLAPASCELMVDLLAGRKEWEEASDYALYAERS